MYFPVSLKVGGERCLVVGGGPIGLRKARSLLRAGAFVTVISPDFVRGFDRLEVTRRRRRFRAADLRGVFLTISAADDPAVNGAVSAACRERGVLVNVVDQPRLCTFILPAVVRRGPVTISISTGGQSPGLAKALRLEVERLAPASLGAAARTIGRERRRILRALPPSAARTRLLKGLAARAVTR